jgi:hypothetical protein
MRVTEPETLEIDENENEHENEHEHENANVNDQDMEPTVDTVSTVQDEHLAEESQESIDEICKGKYEENEQHFNGNIYNINCFNDCFFVFFFCFCSHFVVFNFLFV